MTRRSGISSDDVRKWWRYAVETDFHAFDLDTTTNATQDKRTLEYATADRFIPFHHPIPERRYTGAVNASRNLLAIADNCDINVYNLDTGERRVLSGHTSDVSAVGFSPTDPDLLVSGSEGVVGVSEGSGKESSVDIDAVATAGIRAVTEGLGTALTLTGDQEDEIRTALRKLIGRFDAYHKVPPSSRLNGRLNTSFQSPLFNNSGNHLIYLPGSRPMANGDDTWDISLFSLQDGTPTILPGHRDAIMWIGFSPDDSLVASAGWDGTFRVYRATTGEALWKWETDKQTWTGVFSPDGLYFAGTDGAGIIRVWDSKTGLETGKDDFGGAGSGGSGWCRMMDWSPCGRYLAVGADDYGRIGMLPLQTASSIGFSSARMLMVPK
ncbi:hypothetical protein QFC24_006741 [Naganishia onofrii]|uniref:Uncharacterized protein n=1 Tax=Naganishia onofrii TaxID=1851511 RepID=A0ACC2WYG8_9TREE|nr:hypothetical protein QFC24_006741 [Naganishia onofrii]